MGDEALGMFAAEIKKLGWFGGNLKARRVNGRYELAFGHRRLEALRRLGREEVDLEVEDLSDEDMARYMAVENFQRHGLTEEERLRVWILVRDKVCGGDPNQARKLLGLGQYLALSLERAAKYSKGNNAGPLISASTILEADRLGGEPMVKTAAALKLGPDVVKHIHEQINKEAGRDAELKERLVKKATEGKIRHPEDVKKEAWKAKEKKFDEWMKEGEKKYRQKHPPDLEEHILGWNKALPPFLDVLEQVASSAKYGEYIMEVNPKAGRELKDHLKRLLAIADKLQKNLMLKLE